MELDVNIDAHDLLWRLMSLAGKQAYVKSWGTLRDELVEKEVARLIESGYARQHGNDLELTPEGKVLYKKMTTRCPKTE
jgi:coproporphyrinogen III oxidase-like Fe-S oxidoreductase